MDEKKFECNLPIFHTPSNEIRHILKDYKTIAVIGLSTDPAKPSHEVAHYMQSHGYRIIPIHPKAQEILGEKVYASLKHLPADIQVEVVDIFRRPDKVQPHVEEAISIGAKAVWFQEGIINNDAAQLAHDAGLEVVQNKCMLKEHKALLNV
jgi:predicted CoA-binding protein